MTGSLLILALVAAQGRFKPDTPEERARRAALVDRVMAEPSPPDLRPRRAPAAADLGVAQEHNQDEKPFQNEKPRDIALPHVPAARPGARPQRYLTLESATLRPSEDSDEAEPPDEAPAAQPMLDLQDAVLGRENFDRWIYGEGLGVDRRRELLHARLVARLDLATQELRLTAPQKDKLGLAGVGDIKRFFDRVEERRREFEKARRDLTAGRRVLAQLLTLSDEFQAGPFGDGSLFAKTLRRIENESGKEGRAWPR